MQIIKVLVAVWIAKSTWWLIHLLRKGKGSSLPGMIALKIFPGILKWFGRQLKGAVVMVTGTNGKTTTSNMLAQVICSSGYSVLSNHEGANLITGVTSAFIRKSNLWGKINCDYAVLEVDEAAFPVVSQKVHPNMVIVTNFFRDQLDRYGELDTTVKMVANALSKLSKTKIVLNADDPLVAQLRQRTGLETVYYGLDNVSGLLTVGADTREAKFCPFCGSHLNYSAYNYCQLGKFTCPGCDFHRPSPHLRACQIIKKGEFFEGIVNYQDETYSLAVPARGVYNFYNAVAALSGAVCLDIEPGLAVEVLRRHIPAAGRMDRFEYEGKPLLLNLVKNPTGFNQALTALINQGNVQDVLIAINDNAADGRDVSWLWDVDFEIMGEFKDRFCSFVCTGQRAEEIAVRLKYAGMPLEKIMVHKKMDEAIDRVLLGCGKTGFLLATYTALWPIESILAKKAKRVKNYAESVPSVS